MGIIQFSVFLRNTRQEQNPQIIIMNPKTTAALAVLAMSSVAQGTLVIGTVAAGTTVTVGAGAVLGAALLGGAAVLKGLVIGRALGRKKRSAEEDSEDAVFAVLTNAEPAQCYRRLICDMAAGAIPDQDKILSLFNTEVSPVSPKFEYSTAAKVGKIVKNAGLCEVRYSCPLNSQEIAKLFN